MKQKNMIRKLHKLPNKNNILGQAQLRRIQAVMQTSQKIAELALGLGKGVRRIVKIHLITLNADQLTKLQTGDFGQKICLAACLLGGIAQGLGLNRRRVLKRKLDGDRGVGRTGRNAVKYGGQTVLVQRERQAKLMTAAVFRIGLPEGGVII